MLINEVEAKTGLTKKSIRYYEEKGLLNPKRNKENEYREYDEEDIQLLMVIKFLRELNIPIKTIQDLVNDEISLHEVMDDQIFKIEKEQRNYQKVKGMCQEILESNMAFDQLDVEKYLHETNVLKKEGFMLNDIEKDHRKKKQGAILSSVIFGGIEVLVMIALTISWIQFEVPNIAYAVGMITLSTTFLSIVYSLILRIQEINGGEEDEASKY